MRILLVEDERPLSDVLCALLKQNDCTVDAVYDGVSGEDYAMSGIYDVIVLDIMLPGKDGVAVLQSIRSQGLITPVLLLTAKSEVEDKIRGLDSGADDYLTKPFATGELLARIRAMTRRKGEITGDEISCGGTKLHKNSHAISHQGATVKLGAKEFQMMELLMENKQQIIPKERLMEKIWGFESEAEYNAIEVYISFIRKKLSAIQADISIKAVRGVGYALEENA